MSDSFLPSIWPPFIPEPFLVLPDGFVSGHILLTYPLIIAVWIPLPLDQVLLDFLFSVVARI